jgi:hypothetical protein
MIQDISSQLVESFAQCLQSQLTAQPDVAAAVLTAQAKPVSGLSLFFGAIRRAVARIFGRG